MTGFELYCRLASASLRAKMQYKVDFIVSGLLNGALMAVDFVLLAAILLRFKEIAGWDIFEVGVLYGMSSIAMAFYRSFAPELHHFEPYILQGEFDGLLVRPWPTLLSLLGRNVEPHRLGGALQGGIILGICVAHLRQAGRLDVGEAIYIGLASVLGALIPFSLALVTATLAFWIVRLARFDHLARRHPTLRHRSVCFLAAGRKTLSQYWELDNIGS